MKTVTASQAILQGHCGLTQLLSLSLFQAEHFAALCLAERKTVQQHLESLLSKVILKSPIIWFWVQNEQNKLSYSPI